MTCGFVYRRKNGGDIAGLKQPILGTGLQLQQKPPQQKLLLRKFGGAQIHPSSSEKGRASRDLGLCATGVSC